tara:strand:- start:56296 stop:57150 length:855 start_codon:yes stop_codon:yes gene_type:complete
MKRCFVFLLAASFIAGFSLAAGTSKSAAKKEDSAAQSREIIEIAQNLVLQKDRDQAIRLLNKALLTEKNKTVVTEIRSILKDIGSLFLFDKSQQEYESSISFKKTEPSKWLASVERAQKIEPDNTLIMLELIRNQVGKKNLGKAKEILEEFRVKNAFDKNVILAGVFLGVASSDGKDISILKTRVKDLQLPNFAAINSYIELLERVLAGNKEKALQALAIWKKEDSLNPQTTYWEKRINGSSKPDDELICESFPEHLYRRYYYDLFFCSSALENFFKFKDVNQP